MRIDRDCRLDETQQKTQVPFRLSSSEHAPGAVRLWKATKTPLATMLKLATDLARGVLSVLPMRLYNARGLVQRASTINQNPTAM